MKQQPVTALAMDPNQNMRAAYVVLDNERAVERKYPVIGWAAVGGRVWPLRMDQWLGRAVLVGTDDDPDAERFFGLLMAGGSLADLGEDVDRRVRDLLRRDLEDERDATEG